MIDLEKLLRVPYVDPYNGFDISPDGAKIAFSWNKTGRWEIYELPLSGNAPDSPQPAAIKPAPCPGQGRPGEAGAEFAPKYSPDGSRLAYVVDFDGGEKLHLFVHDFETGTRTDLTTNAGFALQPGFCWSPDGSEIAFISNQSGNFDAYVMPSTGGSARCVLAIGRPAWDVRWSPDGRWLAVTFQSRGQDFGVGFVGLESGDSFFLSDADGPLNAQDPAWSPDGAKLAFHSDASNGYHQIGLFDLASREITWLTQGQTNYRAPSWSRNGRRLACVGAQGASDQILVCSLDGETVSYQVEPGVHYMPRFTPDGMRLLLLFNNQRRPPDLWMFSLEGGEMHQLTHSLPVGLHGLDFTTPEEVSYPGMDGTPIPALLFKPEGADETTPAVVVVHGGPSWHYQVEWYPLMAHLASRGWVVLAPNYRGSTGYGRDWQNANRFDLGGVDTHDVAAGAQFLLREKLADPAKIAVTGRSHGGYLSMTCLTQYPELWAAGSGVVPFLNWFTCHERSRDDLVHWDLEMMGDPNHNHDLWYERSPYFFLDRIRVPVQLICGAHDPRCPAEDSIQAHERLLELGKQVDFHLYEDEGHSFLKTENLVDSEVRRVEFLARLLEGQDNQPRRVTCLT